MRAHLRTFSFKTQRSKSMISRFFCAALISLSWVSTGASQPKSSPVDLSREQLGGARLGETLSQLELRLGPARTHSKPFKDVERGCTKQIHYYDNGLEVEACTRDNRSIILSLRVVKKSAVKTIRGIGPGSTLDEVSAAYPEGDLRDGQTYVLNDKMTKTRLHLLIEERKVYEINFFKEKSTEIRIDSGRRSVRSGF